MSTRYNLKSIRTLLAEGFNTIELRRLCSDVSEFRAVEAQLTEHTSKSEIIDRLIQHAQQKLLFESLLAWAKEETSQARYEAHQPYTSLTVPDPHRDKPQRDVVTNETGPNNNLDVNIGGRIEGSTIIISGGDVITTAPFGTQNAGVPKTKKSRPASNPLGKGRKKKTSNPSTSARTPDDKEYSLLERFRPPEYEADEETSTWQPQVDLDKVLEDESEVSYLGLRAVEDLTLPDDDQRAAWRKQLAIHRTNLNRLEEQKAKYTSLNVPIHILHQIDEEIAEIERLLILLGDSKPN